MILETKIYFWKIDKLNTIAFAKPKIIFIFAE
jgi:hypothetical protein